MIQEKGNKVQKSGNGSLIPENARVLIENAPIGIFYCDFHGTFLYGNRVSEKLIGYGREEIVGNRFQELALLSDEDKEKATELMANNILGKTTGPAEFMPYRKDGNCQGSDNYVKAC